ncbi:MAG: hypothetical protein ACTHLE_19895 [Agriterribacter sp.]
MPPQQTTSIKKERKINKKIQAKKTTPPWYLPGGVAAMSFVDGFRTIASSGYGLLSVFLVNWFSKDRFQGLGSGFKVEDLFTGSGSDFCS